MSTQHVEFPELTQEARAAFNRGYEANGLFVSTPGEGDRVRFAAFLREAMKQSDPVAPGGRWGHLEAIAANLHNPPPTLAQAREADLDTPEGKATVSAFLATLGERVQP